MADNYRSAALRHYDDAELLRNSARLDNAGHLIGFAAECAIKHRLSTLPVASDVHGHFPELLAVARKHLGARANYTGMYELVRGPIFDGWTVHLRYAETGVTTEAELEMWFQQTKRLMGAASIRREG